MPPSSPIAPASCPAPAPETRARALGAIREALAAQLGRTLEVDERDDLQRDLHLDSLELLTLAVSLEDRFQVQLAEEDSQGIRTMGDLADIVARRASERPR